MKRKQFVFCNLTICLLFLAACGQESSNDVSPEGNSLEKTDFYVQEDQIIPGEGDEKDEIVYPYEFEEIDIYCYPNSEKVVLDNRVEKKEFLWSAGYPSYYENEENFHVGSFLNNGKNSLSITR